jgi:hypothetical protein
MGRTNYFEAVNVAIYICNTDLTALHGARNLGTTGSILFLHLRQLSIYKARKLVFTK